MVIPYETLKSIRKQTKITLNFLKKLRSNADSAEDGSSHFPFTVDYTKDNTSIPIGVDEYGCKINPYKNRYGDEWMTKITKVRVSGLTHVVCITDLVKHIDSETKKVYKDTQFSTSYMWYHDALKQLTDKSCVKWMKDNGYWNHWIKPELGLNDLVETYDPEKKKNITSTRYGERPVGNQADVMPMDASLNQDILVNFDMHILLTDHLKNDDDRKYSKSTPKTISKAILKLYDPDNGVVPCSRRIIEDVSRVVNYALPMIVKAGGAVVPELVNRNGHRNVNPPKRGSVKKTKMQNIKTMDELGIMKDVQDVAIQFIEEEKKKFDAVNPTSK